MELKKLNTPKINEPIKKWATEQTTFSKEEVHMVKKHMKKFSPSLAIKEMQIKTTLRFYLTLVRIAFIKNTTNNKCWQGCRGKKNSHHCCGNVIKYNQFGKQYGGFLKKLNIDLLYDPAIPLLRMYLKECNSGYSKGTCTHIYFSTIHNSQGMKQPICPTTDEWFKKIW
jgi:hypothetical protein